MQRGEKMSTKIPIENKLKQYILTKYKSIRAFTQAAEIPYSTVDSMIKKGIDGTGINTISKICKTLSIELESLASGRIVPIDEDNNTKTSKKSPMTFSEKHLIQNYNKLNEKGKEKLLAYSEDLIGNEKYIEIEQKEKHA